MMERRREASATGPSTYSPAASGPRCTSISLIASRRARSGAPAIPQIPHMGPSLGAAAARSGRERVRRGVHAFAAPDEARVPAGGARLVHELEVEERTHVRLAGLHVDRSGHVARLLRRRDLRRLKAVLEVPDR